MAWTYVASSSAGGSAGTNLTGISRPAGVAVGDWIALTFVLSLAGQTHAFSNGTWTKIRSDVVGAYESSLYLSRYNGEGATFDISWDGSSRNRSAALSAYRGGDVASTGDSAAPTGTGHVTGTAGTTISFDGFTPAVAGDLILYGVGEGNATANQTSAPTGSTPTLTERVDLAFATQGDGIQTTAQAIGNRTATIVSAAINVGQLFAFTLLGPTINAAVVWAGTSGLTVAPAIGGGVAWAGASSFAVAAQVRTTQAVAWAGQSAFAVTGSVVIPGVAVLWQGTSTFAVAAIAQTSGAVAWAAQSAFAVAPTLIVPGAVAWAGASAFGVVHQTRLALAVVWAGTARWRVVITPLVPVTGVAPRTFVAPQRALAVTARIPRERSIW